MLPALRYALLSVNLTINLLPAHTDNPSSSPKAIIICLIVCHKIDIITTKKKLETNKKKCNSCSKLLHIPSRVSATTRERKNRITIKIQKNKQVKSKGPLQKKMPPQHSYYDIDGILAEEELIPCTTLFEFSHLGDLDPDGTHHQQQQQKGQHETNVGTFLPENSRIKIPLWAVEKWAMLGFVRLQLPRHYGRRARERYDADPGDANLRKRNERFFLSGRRLVHLIEQSSTEVAKAIAKLPRRNSSNSMIRHTQALRQVSEEARSLRRTLLQTYAGERLRKVFDWSQSSGGGKESGGSGGDYEDDVSGYLNQLTEMEQRLYYAGSSAVTDLEEWKLYGNRRLWMGPTQKKNNNNNSNSNNNNKATTTATPGGKGGSHNNKRSVTPTGGEDARQTESAGQRRRLQ